MKNPITFNPKRDLPYLAAVAQIVQYVFAGYTLFGPAGCVSGFFMGALVSMTVAYATSQYFETAKERKPAAMVFLVILLAFSPIVVGTAAYLDLPFKGFWASVVAASWGILPDFSVALDGFIAGRGMVKRDESEKPQVETTKPAKHTEIPAPIIPAWKSKPYRCEVCEVGYDTQREYAGHCGGKPHKERSQPQVYAMTIEPVTKNGKAAQ